MRHDIISTGTPVLHDAFGIGQRSVARIQRDSSAALMLDCARSILSTEYAVPECLRGRVETYQVARRDYDDAMAVLEAQE